MRYPGLSIGSQVSLRWPGRSFHAEFGDVFSQPLGRIEFRQKLHRWDFQRLTEVEHLEVAYPDELTLKLRYPRPIDFPADNLKPGGKLVLLETEYNWNATNDFTCYGRQGLANGAEIGSRHRS